MVVCNICVEFSGVYTLIVWNLKENTVSSFGLATPFAERLVCI